MRWQHVSLACAEQHDFPHAQTAEAGTNCPMTAAQAIRNRPK
jgi:hypothetical protein